MGTGVAFADGDVLTAAKVNLKLETVAASEIDAGVAVDCTFMVNTFLCPAPGTDWTPLITGVQLAASKTGKKCWIPLGFLKIGDVIKSYKLVGDAIEADAITLDCKLVQVNKADPLTTTDVTTGAIAQVTANGNFDVQADCTDTTVATDKQYNLEILGTTGVGDTINVMGAEVLITRIIKPS